MNDRLLDIDSLDWNKGDGLLPAIVQDARSEAVLMLGYMNREALRETLEPPAAWCSSAARSSACGKKARPPATRWSWFR